MANYPTLSMQLTSCEDTLEIRASAYTGDARAETSIPPAALQLDQVMKNDPTNVSASVLEEIGALLYKHLMAGDVAHLCRDTLQDGIRLNQPVHFELRFDADQIGLAKFPWELITDELGRVLVRDGLVDLTRYISYPQPLSSFQSSQSELPLLHIVSQPKDLPAIFVPDLKFRKVETLKNVTFDLFLQKMLIERQELWGLQFDGHGAMVLVCPKCGYVNFIGTEHCITCSTNLVGCKQMGVLAFEKNGISDWITAKEFGSVLYNAKVQFAMLLACETSHLGSNNIFNSLAPSLILAGIPAVVGMQFPVLDSFANNFTNGFYNALYIQNDLLMAVRTARRMNIQGMWYAPTLYLRHRKPDNEPNKPLYQTRDIDTAVPSQVEPGVNFLARLWIRRSNTQPLSPEQLKLELGIRDGKVNVDTTLADVKFEPVIGREFRRGEVDVELASNNCDVKPEKIKLFVSENLDAPPAIFSVRAKQVGTVPLIFTVSQDGGQIASIVHQVEVGGSYEFVNNDIRLHTAEMPLGNDDGLYTLGIQTEVVVTITDPTGAQSVIAKLPVDVPMSRLVPALVIKMGLPINPYGVHHKKSGKRLGSNDTFGSAGITDGDILTLIPEMVAGCFLAGTKISISHEITIEIEKLNIGDEILTYDLEHGRLSKSEVLSIYNGLADEYFVINKILCVTGSHPIYIGNKWATVGDIKLGDFLYGQNLEKIEVVTFEKVVCPSPVPVYNLHLDECHTLFANGILVHNAKINVTIVDSSGSKVVTAEVVDDVSLERMLPTLISKMQLPIGNYAIFHKNSGKQIGIKETLNQAGVKENDVLRLIQDVTAGGPLGGDIEEAASDGLEILVIEEGDLPAGENDEVEILITEDDLIAENVEIEILSTDEDINHQAPPRGFWAWVKRTINVVIEFFEKLFRPS